MKPEEPVPAKPNWSGLAHSFLSESKAESATDGMQYGDYLLEEEVARGGMGIVYRARQLSLDRTVALKVMREGMFAGGQEIERFRQEASAAAALRHPGIVPVFDSGECQGRFYYAMEWIAGQNLAEQTRENPASANDAARWVREAAEAMQHAHSHGVVHRDLKPANVMLDYDSRARVTDFGMAQRADAMSGLTLSGQMLGTPGYMAPEMACGNARTAGAAADIYGLGALLFHLVTGRAPFIGESHSAILRQLAEAEPVSPRLLNPSVPRDLETVCLKALNREPSRRYGSAQDMADDLARFLDGRPVVARPVSGIERGWRWCRRKPAMAASLAAIALLLTSVAGISFWSAVRVGKARAAEAAGRREARQNLYAADVRMAGQLYHAGSLEAARRLLEGHIPADGAEDFRGYDWHLLSSMLAGDQQRQARLPVAPLGDDMPVSPDGKWALLLRNSRATLVELATQRTVAEWTEMRGSGFFLRHVLWCAPAGRIIVTGSDRIRLIAPENGDIAYLGEAGVETAALSHDGRTLATGPARAWLGTPPARIDLWDTIARETKGQILIPRQSRALAWTPDDSQIIAGIYPRTIQWWRPSDAQPARQLELETSGIAANMPWAWFSPDAAYAVIPWWDGENGIPIYDLKDGSMVERLTGLSHGAARFAWSPDARWLAGSGSEQSLLLFERNRWDQPRMLRGPLGLTGGVGFSAAGELVSVSADQVARWWSVPPSDKSLLYPNDMSGSHVWRPVWSPDGTLVTLTSRFGINGSDHSMRGVLWDWAKKAPRFEWNEIGLAFSPDSRRVLTVERNAIYRIRDTTSGVEVRKFELEREGGYRLPRVSPDGRWMVAWHEPGAALLYDLNTMKSVAALNGGSEASFSPDSRHLARESAGRLVLRELSTGTERATNVPCQLAIAWSPAGDVLATRFDSELHLVNAATGRQTVTLSGHTSRIGVIHFLPDRLTLLTTAEDASLRFWNLATLRETLVLTTPNPCLYYCTSSPDGRSILAGGSRGYLFYSLPESVSLVPAALPPAPSGSSIWRE